MKGRLREALEALGISTEDLGTASGESVDYPDYAAAVARRVSAEAADVGVLVCGTGIGMSITANKFPGVRAALLYDDTAARFSRLHNDANIAVFGARTMSGDDAVRRLRLFLEQPFEAGRHSWSSRSRRAGTPGGSRRSAASRRPFRPVPRRPHNERRPCPS